MVLKDIDFAKITNAIAMILKKENLIAELALLGNSSLAHIANNGGRFGRCMLTIKGEKPFLAGGQLQFTATSYELHKLTAMEDNELFKSIGEPILVMHPLAEALNNSNSKFHYDDENYN